MKTKKLTKALAEASVMIAFATVLSLIKLVEMPYGGSVTLASMLPIVIVAYRHGVPFGLLTGFTHAVIQQLIGLSSLSYFTTWQSILAVIILDYVLAFTIVGLGGFTKNRIGLKRADYPTRQRIEIAVGMLFVCVLRYICHTVAGATVWAGLSIPTEAALIYSISYNATYMIPETIIAVLVAAWIGEVIDFSKNVPTRFSPSVTYEIKKQGVACEILPHIATFLILFAVGFVTVIIAPYLQDASSGEFTFENLSCANWSLVLIVSSLCLVAAVVLYVVAHKLKGTQKTI